MLRGRYRLYRRIIRSIPPMYMIRGIRSIRYRCRILETACHRDCTATAPMPRREYVVCIWQPFCFGSRERKWKRWRSRRSCLRQRFFLIPFRQEGRMTFHFTGRPIIIFPLPGQQRRISSLRQKWKRRRRWWPVVRSV